MGSRDKDQTTHQHHQPLLSSLVVRASDSDGGGRGGSDYEPGEVRRDPPPYSRSDRYFDDPGYRIRAGSGSPLRRRNADHEYGSDFDNLGDLQRNRGVGNGRDAGRYRAISPPYGRGRGGDRPFGRDFDGPGFVPGPFRGESMNRSHPNVRPREGDWYCPDPICGNLNFARREYCNTCKKQRYGSGGGSPRRGYAGPPPPSRAPPRRFAGPTNDRSPGRPMMGYRSPPRGLARGGPRDFGGRGTRDFGGRGPRDFGGRGPRDLGGRGPRDFGGRGPRDFGGRGSIHPRHSEGRFPVRNINRDRADMEYTERNKFDRALGPDWSPSERGREEDMFNDRKGYERRPQSPPAPPPQAAERGRWPRDVRERSRSPIRGMFSPKEYRRDMFMERGRDDRRGGLVRETVGDDGY